MNINLSTEIWNVIWKIIFWMLLIFALGLVMFAFGGRNIYLFLFGVLPCGLVLGFLFVKVYLPKISESIGFGFFFPKRFLKKKPLVLSPFIGMLSGERYEEAFIGLKPLVEEHPEHTDAVFLFAKAAMNLPGCTGVGFSVMERHFSLKEREPSDNHVKLLFYYSDLVLKSQSDRPLISIFEQELLLNIYTDSERNSIRIRLDSIRRKQKCKSILY